MGSGDPQMGSFAPQRLPAKAGQRAVSEMAVLQSQHQKRGDKYKECSGGAHKLFLPHSFTGKQYLD